MAILWSILITGSLYGILGLVIYTALQTQERILSFMDSFYEHYVPVLIQPKDVKQMVILPHEVMTFEFMVVRFIRALRSHISQIPTIAGFVIGLVSSLVLIILNGSLLPGGGRSILADIWPIILGLSLGFWLTCAIIATPTFYIWIVTEWNRRHHVMLVYSKWSQIVKVDVPGGVSSTKRFPTALLASIERTSPGEAGGEAQALVGQLWDSFLSSSRELPKYGQLRLGRLRLDLRQMLLGSHELDYVYQADLTALCLLQIVDISGDLSGATLGFARAVNQVYYSLEEEERAETWFTDVTTPVGTEEQIAEITERYLRQLAHFEGIDPDTYVRQVEEGELVVRNFWDIVREHNFELEPIDRNTGLPRVQEEGE